MSSDPSVLTGLVPQHEFFIGIDSDGCVFDTMEIKQKECFIPNIVRCWHLQPISKYVRRAAEFVNLYSKWRGINRFPALLKTFDLLEDWDEVRRRNVTIPRAESLRAWVARESKLGNPVLQAEVERTGDPVLAQALAWSLAVNVAVSEIVQGGMPPFPYARQVLERARNRADMIVVSQTPAEALLREWEEQGMDGLVRAIAGQELGTKTEHIRLAAGGKYAPERMLMIGDAPGDRKAADANHALFFPIVPGREEESWQQLYEEGLDRFFNGTFAGAYQQQLVEAFEAELPDVPPWKR